MLPLVLASTSRYRAELLQRLGLRFECVAPAVEEMRLPDESSAGMARRLAHAKAAAVARQRPGHWVIGSDQAAELNGQTIGKPGSVAAAQAQLAAMSGKTVRFHTSVCLFSGQETLHGTDLTEVRFRSLQAGEIERYVAAEMPLDCAGSFKCEGLGITLFEAIDSRDPTALIGLPLILLSKLLRQTGCLLP